MLVIIVVMILILALAGLVVAYVAYPHRGEQLPAAPWLGEAMARAVDAAPLVEPVHGREYAPEYASELVPDDADRRH